jgi:hypothetical protein
MKLPGGAIANLGKLWKTASIQSASGSAIPTLVENLGKDPETRSWSTCTTPSESFDNGRFPQVFSAFPQRF